MATNISAVSLLQKTDVNCINFSAFTAKYFKDYYNYEGGDLNYSISDSINTGCRISQQQIYKNTSNVIKRQAVSPYIGFYIDKNLYSPFRIVTYIGYTLENNIDDYYNFDNRSGLFLGGITSYIIPLNDRFKFIILGGIEFTTVPLRYFPKKDTPSNDNSSMSVFTGFGFSFKIINNWELYILPLASILPDYHNMFKGGLNIPLDFKRSVKPELKISTDPVKVMVTENNNVEPPVLEKTLPEPKLKPEKIIKKKEKKNIKKKKKTKKKKKKTVTRTRKKIPEKKSVLHKNKPTLIVNLDDIVYINANSSRIGFTGYAYNASSLVINGISYDINPETSKFYAMVVLERQEETTVVCTATDDKGRATTVTKTVLRRL
ncbi:MAG: hypothetical protein GY730_05530 [bacterium]|nr:hypothetical protein [bacterium]